MRKILFVCILGCFVAICAHAAHVANLDYVHKLIQQKWNISIPIKADNPMLAANMKYLLTAVDVANEILNGEKTTDYGNGEFATLHAADTVATNQAVDTLIQKTIEYKFFMDIDMDEVNYMCLFFGVPEDRVSVIGLDFSAAGTFYIDWGDGTTETIKKTDTENISYFHDYGTTSGVFTIKIGGKAIDYSDDSTTFYLNGRYDMCSRLEDGLVRIDGSLGAIFGTLADGSQPNFSETFSVTGLRGGIPENLFDGIHGDLVDGMFVRAFAENGWLTGPSARINGKYLYEIWPDATCDQVGGMYNGLTGLDDWDNIPDLWKDYYGNCL